MTEPSSDIQERDLVFLDPPLGKQHATLEKIVNDTGSEVKICSLWSIGEEEWDVLKVKFVHRQFYFSAYNTCTVTCGGAVILLRN